MSSAREKLDEARRELLDLGLRNTLINCRLLKTRGIELVDQDLDRIYQISVEEGRKLSFDPAQEANNGQEDIFDEPEENTPRTANRLKTTHLSIELQRRLLNTHYAARTHIEERGVNILYLALGMLEWYEATSSEIVRRAPLILVPVQLERSGVRSRFRLSHTGEDVGGNLSLQAKLDAEFRIKLPLPDTEEEIDVGQYLSSVKTLVTNMPRWSVVPSASIGFFSFAKFLMYHDLDVDNWPESDSPTDHPITNALLEMGFEETESYLKDDDHIDDHVDPIQSHHIVDADSSQTLAILDVARGRNLVIQGPPGTGKSQTITNLIAAVLGQGKKVLFVAEKMAALDVVKRNLDKVGIGDACLELHSNKTNKKAVIQELKRIMALGEPQLDNRQQDADLIQSTRSRLNHYSKEVNEPIGKSSVSPHHAYGKYLEVNETLQGFELPIINDQGFANWSDTDFRLRLAAVQELQVLLRRMGVPVDHLFWGSKCKVFLPDDQTRVQQASTLAVKTVAELESASQELASRLAMDVSKNRRDVEYANRTAQKALESPKLQSVSLKAEEWLTRSVDLLAGLEAGAEIQQLHEGYSTVLLVEAWNHDIREIRAALNTYGRGWWRFLSGRYRNAVKELSRLCAHKIPKDIDARLRIVDVVRKEQELSQSRAKIEELGPQLFGSLWHNTDWELFTSIAEYLRQVHQAIQERQIDQRILDYLESNHEHIDIRQLTQEVQAHLDSHEAAIRDIITQTKTDETQRFGEAGLGQCEFQEQRDILEQWSMQPQRMQDMVSFNHLAETLEECGLGQILQIGSTWRRASDRLVDFFQRAWFNSLIHEAIRSRPSLARFDSDTHQFAIQQFCEMDTSALEHNRRRVAHKHWEGLPRQNSSGGQVGVLKHEFEKRARFRPIRKLIEEAGNAIQAIKPVFMMSPLSVATFLPPGNIQFDLVIFDEASQVRPVDAFGAILRGEQVVVTGDSMQLPPTSFFDKMLDDTEENSEDTTADMESILGLFCAKNAPQRMLRWHYRSRHESLIAVSNREFYDNGLELFPSPDAAKADVGLVYHHLPETVYDRGRSGRNREEARMVAQAVIEHTRNSSNLSLGVATFSMVQMQAILDQLELLRLENPRSESFFNRHPEEPFFVKNLENVQGDERDVIFISVGYGRAADGQLTMNFGPLNQDGGERRLNVLITRARRRCEVFANLTSDDIDLSRTQAKGVHALKRYLKYAATGELDMPELTGRGPDSPFEEQVAAALRGTGCQVEHQVGSAGFFIDLAIIDETYPGRYLLGVECDGATYHSARSARDRDRLRQQVLEGMGWRLHRIWSTDWFKDPERELRKVLDAIETARIHGNTRKEEKKQPEFSVERTPEEYLPPETGTRAYQCAQLGDLSSVLGSAQLHEINLSDYVRTVIRTESPVHLDELARRVTRAFGVKRVGARIRGVFEEAVTHLVYLGEVRRESPFLWWTEISTVVARNRSLLPVASRKLDLVASEEIESAITEIVQDALGMDRGAIPLNACKLLGFRSVSEDMRQRLEALIDDMIKEGKLRLQGSSLVVGDD